jgi:hypothetical protein
MSEPVAVRYDFDGHGYLYMDAGSGSDWASRVKDCEFLYTHPMRELNEPIAYCVDLEEDALIEASKILGLDPTDVNFLDTPLYAHPMRELSDEEITKLMDENIHSIVPFYAVDEYIAFARAILKKANEK